MHEQVIITPHKGFAEYVFSNFYGKEIWNDWESKKLSGIHTDKARFVNLTSLFNHFGLNTDLVTVSNFCYLLDILDEKELYILKTSGYTADFQRENYRRNKEINELRFFLKSIDEQENAYRKAIESWKESWEESGGPTPPNFTLTFKSFGKEPKTLELKHVTSYIVKLLTQDPFLSLPINEISPTNEIPTSTFLKKSLVIIDKALIRMNFTFQSQTDKYTFIQHIFELSSVEIDEVTTDTNKYFPQLARRAKQEGYYNLIEDPLF